MNQIYPKVLFVLFTLMTSSCNYDFADDYYLDLEEANPDNTNITIKSFTNGQTINSKVSFNYSYNGENPNTLKATEILIDNKVVLRTGETKGTFIISPSDYLQGQHSLLVRYRFTSGTGSFAEKTGNENFEKSDTYYFIIDGSVSKAPNVIGVKTKNGSLIVNWTKSSNNTFDKAILYIGSKKIELTKEQVEAGTDTINVFIETDKQLEYYISFENDVNKSIGESVLYTVEDSSNFTITLISDSKYKLSWEDHPLYNSFDFYKISRGSMSDESSGWKVLGSNISNRKNEIIIETKSIFGKKYEFKIEPIDNSNNSIIDYKIKKLYLGKSFDSDSTDNIIYSSKVDKYFSIKGKHRDHTFPWYLRIYNNKFQVEKEVLIGNKKGYSKLIIDPLTDHIILDTSVESIVIDENNYSIIKRYSGSEYANYSLTITKVSYRKGVVAIEYKGNYLELLNSETKELITKQQNTNFSISDDGKYVFIGKRLYQIIDNKLSLIIDTEATWDVISDFSFNTGKFVYCIVSKDAFVTIVDLETGVKNVTNIPQCDRIWFDKINGNILYYNSKNSKINLYNPSTGDIRSLYSERYYYLTYSIANNCLISRWGLYLDNFNSIEK